MPSLVEPRPLKVLVASSPSFPIVHPREMGYGGIQRAIYWYLDAFVERGIDVIPVVSNDSLLPFPHTKSAYWPHPAVLGNANNDPFWLEDYPDLDERFGRHIATSALDHDPDIILLLGPKLPLLRQIATLAPAYLERTVVSLRNGPKAYGQEQLSFLERHRELSLVALTESHRKSFGVLSRRIRLVREGIPVARHAFASSAADHRATFSSPHIRHPERRLVTQLDRIYPGKGQLIGLAIFEAARLHERGYDYVIGGSATPFAPSRVVADDDREERRYFYALQSFIDDHQLGQFVHFTGELCGAEVEQLSCSSDIAFAPHRTRHGDLWPDSDHGTEAYGRSMAIAIAAGTPVLCSTRVDGDRMATGVTGYRFETPQDGIDAATQLADDVEAGVDRHAIRNFALEHDDLAPAIDGYLALFNEIMERNRHPDKGRL